MIELYKKRGKQKIKLKKKHFNLTTGNKNYVCRLS